MEATAVLQSHPADGCHATKEDLIADGLKGIEFCPICFEDHNIRCEVANHPPATGYLIIFIIVPLFVIIFIWSLFIPCHIFLLYFLLNLFIFSPLIS
jgi:hypothetical protein